MMWYQLRIYIVSMTTHPRQLHIFGVVVVVGLEFTMMYTSGEKKNR